MKILVVDDSSTIRRIITGALQNLGYKDIIQAEDGVQALARLDGSQIGFILTDWNMPNMNGIEFTKEVRRRDEYKKIPIIMITTEAEKQSVVEAVKAGVSDYLVKPFTPNVLDAKIRATVEKFNIGT